MLSKSEVISWKTLNKHTAFLCFNNRGLSRNLSMQHYNNMKTFTIGQNRATHHSCCLQCERRVRDNMKDRERTEREKVRKEGRDITEVFLRCNRTPFGRVDNEEKEKKKNTDKRDITVVCLAVEHLNTE